MHRLPTGPLQAFPASSSTAMAFTKLVRHVRQHGVTSALQKTVKVLPGYLMSLRLWRIRKCGCCGRMTVFLCNGVSQELRACLFCSANERYELLAQEIRERYGDALCVRDILELDPHSPLKRMLSQARSHTRTFYDSRGQFGSKRSDGAHCEDITKLTFSDASFDLVISSEVLEHVPCLDKAFHETARVLRPGGVHLFTVPPRQKTRRRAEVVNGQVRHIHPPEYHTDPMNPLGALAFWDIGPDLPDALHHDNLEIKITRGPVGKDNRVVWAAERR